jgi:hypothetical protein
MIPRYATLAGKSQHRHLTINMRSYSWIAGAANELERGSTDNLRTGSSQSLNRGGSGLD